MLDKTLNPAPGGGSRLPRFLPAQWACAGRNENGADTRGLEEEPGRSRPENLDLTWEGVVSGVVGPWEGGACKPCTFLGGACLPGRPRTEGAPVASRRLWEDAAARQLRQVTGPLLVQGCARARFISLRLVTCPWVCAGTLAISDGRPETSFVQNDPQSTLNLARERLRTLGVGAWGACGKFRFPGPDGGPENAGV